MMMLLALISSAAFAIVYPPGMDGSELLFGNNCQPGLVKDSTLVLTGDIHHGLGRNRGVVPVEIRQKEGKGIEVFSLDGRPSIRYQPEHLPSGPRVYLGSEPLVKVVDRDWAWSTKIPPGHYGPAAWGFWTHYRPAVERLMQENQARLEDVLAAELHHFWWNGRGAYLLRLPLRNLADEDRFRPMWLFAHDQAEPIPIGRAVDSLRLNGESLEVNGHKVYRFEDSAGHLRYVFERNVGSR